MKKSKKETRSQRIRRLGGYTKEDLQTAINVMLPIRTQFTPTKRPHIRTIVSRKLVPRNSNLYPHEIEEHCIEEFARTLLDDSQSPVVKKWSVDDNTGCMVFEARIDVVFPD